MDLKGESLGAFIFWSRQRSNKNRFLAFRRLVMLPSSGYKHSKKNLGLLHSEVDGTAILRNFGYS